MLLETPNTVAFLPLRGAHDGHVLAMPKRHFDDIYSIPPELMLKLFASIKRLSASLKQIYQAPRVALYAMGFEVQHAHFHLIPVFEPRDLAPRTEFEQRAQERSPEMLRQLNALIAARLHDKA